jgi:hypothetical protein
LLDRGVVAVFQILRHCGADRVQIDVDHRRQHGRFVQQSLTFEAALPEVAGAAILEP